MLTEGIIAEQNIVTGQVDKRAVRPVQHFGFDKNQLFAADIKGITGLVFHEVPILMIMALYNFSSRSSTIDRY